MKLRKLIWLLLSSVALAQGLGGKVGLGGKSGVGGGGVAVLTPVPTFISAVSGSNIRTDTLTTKTWNGAIPASGTYAIPLANASLSGNFRVVWVEYKNSPATTITVTDDKSGGSSTYSSMGAAVQNSTTGHFLAGFYTANSAAGIKNVFVNSSAVVAGVSAAVEEWYNIDSATPIRSYNGLAGANGSTTLDAGSITPTTNDVVLYRVCRTQTPAATSFTKGSQAGITWTKTSSSSDILAGNGCFSQWGIYTGSGAFTPTAQTSAGSGYIALGVALKPATSGTAPSGMYVAGIEHQEIVTGTGTTTTHEFPCKGNLPVIEAGGAPLRWITNITSTNPNVTWSAVGTEKDDGNNTVLSWYSPNVACTDSMVLTVTWNVSTGDQTLLMHDIVGAATSNPFRARIATTGSLLIATPSMFTNDLSQQGYQTLGPQPGMTDGMMLGMDIHNLNTGVSCSSPTGCQFTAIAYGGQSLDGPSTGDQNNDWMYTRITASDIVNWTWVFGQSTEDPGTYAGELNSFLSATGSIVPRVLKGGAATLSNTTTTNTLSYTPTAASHTLAVLCSIDNTGAGLTDITLANSLGDTVTNIGTITTATGIGKFRSFYVKTASASASTHTCTYTGTTTTHRKNILILELDGVDQTNPIDGTPVQTDAAEDGAGNFCSANVTNTNTNDVAVGMAYCGGGVCNNLASVGAGYLYGFEEIAQSKTLAEWKIVSTASSFNACALDQGLAGRAGMATIVFKGGN